MSDVDDCESALWVRDEIQQQLARFIGTKITANTQTLLTEAMQRIIREAAERWRLPFCSGLTAGDLRARLERVPTDVPDHWVMWCDGWDVLMLQRFPSAPTRIGFHLRAINPQFRAPTEKEGRP